MRFLRKAIVLPVAVLALTMLPGVAAADPIDNEAWHDTGDLLGANYDAWDDPATLEVSGSLALTVNVYAKFNCDVTGEIEVRNDWQGGGPTYAYNYPQSTLDTPARNAVTSLQLDGSPATACEPGYGSCTPSSVSFDNLPWSGETSGSQSDYLANVSFTCAGYEQVFRTYPFELRTTPHYSGCIDEFEVIEGWAPYPSVTHIDGGSFQIDGTEGVDCLHLE